jgi:Prenyltransferase and squalene oxidase repeat
MQPTHRARFSARLKQLVPALAAGAALALAAPAAAEVTDEEARLAAAEGAAWIQAQQLDDGRLGFFGGDWAMIALANAGVHAADVRTTLVNPSAQDFYYDEWTGLFPLEGSSIARGLLTGRAAGIQTARLSATENLLAKLAAEFDGRQIGPESQVNEDMFAVISTQHAGAISSIAPVVNSYVRDAQAPDGGWLFTADAAFGDTDMTAAAIASFCAAGATADDPDVAEGLDFLKAVQNESHGGFGSPFFEPNADSTAWVVHALRECGIDPQGPRWTTSTGNTPLDFLISLQRDDGAFRWVPGDDNDNLYATQDAISALVGEGFGAAPAERADTADPDWRPAPDVPEGTTVPLALVLDHDPAAPGADRMCSIEGAVGAPLAEVLEGAAATAEPAGCVSELQLDASGGEARVTSVNTVGEQPGAAVWEASLDGAPSESALAGEAQLGSVIALALRGVSAGPDDPEEPADGGPSVQPDVPTPMPEAVRPAARLAKARLARNRTLTLGRGGKVRVMVRCPRGLGATGCPGMVTVKFRPGGRGEPLRRAGRSTFVLASGENRLVSVKLRARLRRLVERSGGGRRVRIEAATRDPDTGATTVTRVSGLVTAR